MGVGRGATSDSSSAPSAATTGYGVNPVIAHSVEYAYPGRLTHIEGEMTRDTTTGDNFEDIVKLCIEKSCKKNGLVSYKGRFVGEKPGGGRHKIDHELVSLTDENCRGLVSCKKQGTSGSAQEKVAYEVIKLLHLMKQDQRYRHAWLVLGGTGFSADIKEFLRNDIYDWIPALRKGQLTIVLSTDELMGTDINLPC
jgi:hypothetical protein